MKNTLIPTDANQTLGWNGIKKKNIWVFFSFYFFFSEISLYPRNFEKCTLLKICLSFRIQQNNIPFSIQKPTLKKKERKKERSSQLLSLVTHETTTSTTILILRHFLQVHLQQLLHPLSASSITISLQSTSDTKRFQNQRCN